MVNFLLFSFVVINLRVGFTTKAELILGVNAFWVALYLMIAQLQLWKIFFKHWLITSAFFKLCSNVSLYLELC